MGFLDVLIAFLVPFLDIGIEQSPMLHPQPPTWAHALPGYGPGRLLIDIDAALTPAFDETGALLLALTTAAALLFRRAATSPRRHPHRPHVAPGFTQAFRRTGEADGPGFTQAFRRTGEADGRTAMASAAVDGEPERDGRPTAALRPHSPRPKGPPHMSLTRPHRGRTALAMGGVFALLSLTGCSNGGNGTAPASSSSPAATSGGPAAARIVIENFTFSPADLQVRPGAKITVVNRDSTAHTVTATGDKKPFDTGNIAAGATATFTAPSTTGSYSYVCTIHPNMKGTLTVR
ncbi:cupredoxin domain-containing protein [Streptomyces sp. NPDC017202]|uniref:cupredoxin domain-containing protein n=1 Tax=Streptomyces sp. NPDC017202 TaxID=3364981 RepID=UPI0037B34551